MSRRLTTKALLAVLHISALFSMTGCDEPTAPSVGEESRPAEAISPPPVQEEATEAPPEPEVQVDVEGIKEEADALSARLRKVREALPALDAKLKRCEGEQPEATILTATQLGALTAAPLDTPVEPYFEGSWEETGSKIETLSDLLLGSEPWTASEATRYEETSGVVPAERGIAVVQAMHVRAPSSRTSWEYDPGSSRGRVVHFDGDSEVVCASYFEAWNAGTLTAQAGGLVGAAKAQLATRVTESVRESFKENRVPDMIMPAPGTGNLEGKIYYGDEPLTKHKVKLCTTFDPYWSGCGGKTYKASTDAYGRYIFEGLKPGKYQGLLMRGGDGRGWVYATGWYGVGNAVIEIEDGKTTFWGRTQSTKDAIKLTAPKRNATVPLEGLEITWEPYENATRYMVTIDEEFSMKKPQDYKYIHQSYDKIEGTSYTIPLTLNPKSKYEIRMKAYDEAGRQLANLKVREFKVKTGSK